MAWTHSPQGTCPSCPIWRPALKEAMRLYPPGVFLIREPLTEDFLLQGYTIPKGTWIHVRLPPEDNLWAAVGNIALSEYGL